MDENDESVELTELKTPLISLWLKLVAPSSSTLVPLKQHLLSNSSIIGLEDPIIFKLLTSSPLVPNKLSEE